MTALLAMSQWSSYGFESFFFFVVVTRSILGITPIPIETTFCITSSIHRRNAIDGGNRIENIDTRPIFSKFHLSAYA